jgi:Zn-dependent protease with chaperone function
MNQDLALNQLIHRHEKIYFTFALIVSIIGYILLLVSIVGFIVLFSFTALSLFLHGLMMAQIRTNGVRLSSRQFPEVYEKVVELCERMEIRKVPDVYVIESGGILNAFATRFFGRNMVVLYSDVFDLINSAGDDELSFIIAHELAHIKRNHIVKQLLILPAMWIPFLGEAYSRACEYTSDRIAVNYISNAEAAMNGLTMLAIGKTLFKRVNRSEYLVQNIRDDGFFVWLAEKMATHPPLPKRIKEIQVFNYNSSSPAYKHSAKVTWAIVGLTLMFFTLIGTSFLYKDKIKEITSSFLISSSSEEEIATIIEAVAEGDTAKVKAQLEAGTDPDIQDADGWTPLMWAVHENNIGMINLFVEAGADPGLQDSYEETALIKAISLDYNESVETLIGAGVDINAVDSYGSTPLMAAATYGNMKIVRLLLEAGADPNIRDEDNFTAFLHAKKAGNKDIADLIKQYEKNIK